MKYQTESYCFHVIGGRLESTVLHCLCKYAMLLTKLIFNVAFSLYFYGQTGIAHMTPMLQCWVISLTWETVNVNVVKLFAVQFYGSQMET